MSVTPTSDHLSDALGVYTILPGGGHSDIGELVVHSISSDDGGNRLALTGLLAHHVIDNQTNANVSVALDRTTGGYGALICEFIADLQGRASVMRPDDEETDTTTFRVSLSLGVL